MLKITIELTSRAPMLQRNGRLANPLDPIAQQIAAIAKKRNKTPEDYRVLLPLEAYGGSWETPEGFLGFPTENVLSCLIKAARGFKQGTQVEQALLLDGPGSVEPLLIDGLPVDAKEYAYSDPVNHLFIRTVVINGKRSLRARAIIPTWRTTHHFFLLDDVLNPDDLKKIFVHAGRLIGVGDWRPRYGTFRTKVIDVEAMAEPTEEAA